MTRKNLLTATLVLVGLSNVALCDEDDAAPTGEIQFTVTLPEVAGAEGARAVETIVAADEPITWQVYVPDNYQPGDPAGLMVYVSPSNSGAIPRAWKPVLDRHNMIWISADQSGNKVSVVRRAIFALVALTVAGSHYDIDNQRVYLSGFSGGGKVAGMVAAKYPQLFNGAIFNSGINPLDNHSTPQFELFRHNYYVFITGTKDHALEQTKKVHRQYIDSGIENSKLMVIRSMTHKNPNGAKFDEAIQYLDSHIQRED